MKQKSIWTIFSAILILALLLAACSSAETTNQPAGDQPSGNTGVDAEPLSTEPSEVVQETQPESDQAVPQTGEATTVTVWFHSGREEERQALRETFGDRFNQEFPNITVDLVELPEGGYNEQVQAAAVANNLPCVLDFDGPFVYNYVWGNYMLPIDDYFTEDELSDFLPSIIEQGTYQDGRLYSLGQFDSGLGVWAHRSYLEDAGVRIPTMDDPWDRAEFEDALAKLQELPDVQYALDMKMNYAQSVPAEWLTYGYSPMLQSFGGDLIDRDTYETAEGVLNGPESVEFHTMVQGWFQQGYANANPADDTCFDTGQCALAWVGHWVANQFMDSTGDDLLLLPAVDFGTGPKTGMGSWNWGITSQCPNPDAAAEVLRYIVSPESVLTMAKMNGAIPARQSVMDQYDLYAEDGMLNLFTQQIDAGWAVPRPITAAYPTITAAYSVAFKNIANGADVQTELDAAVDKIDEDLIANDYYR